LATLQSLQTWADKVADKLGLAEGSRPSLRWADKKCPLSKLGHAHCHVEDAQFPRGTICCSQRRFNLASIKEWHVLITHEVVHLAVKSNHLSATFARRMVMLGQANRQETRLTLANKRHRHEWRWANPIKHTQAIRHICVICGAWQEATWGRSHRKGG